MGKCTHSWTSTFHSCRNAGNELLQRISVCFVYFSFLIVLHVSLAFPCIEDDGFIGLSNVQMVLRSKLLIYGKVLRRYPDRRFDYGKGSDVYTAELEVFCVLKGPRTNRIVNITEAGYIPGHCTSTTLSLNQTFIVIADHNGSSYRPVDTEIVATTANLDEVSTACGLDPKYPYGASESTATEHCLTPAPPSQCKDETYFTVTTTTTTKMSSTVDDDYPLYEDSTNPNFPDETNGDKTSRSVGNSASSIYSASLTSLPRSSINISLLHLMALAVTHLVLGFLPPSF